MKYAGPEHPSATAIMSFTGLYVEPLNLDPALIRVEDVAHSLSNQCRFTGHVRRFYSVGEHSVRVALALEAEGQTRDVVRQGLMHDASEAYLVDIPRPLKGDPHFGRAYRGAEARAEAACSAAFGLPRRHDPAVKVMDLRLLATERRDLLPPNGTWDILEGVVPLHDTITTWTPARAERQFLAQYARLFGRETA